VGKLSAVQPLSETCAGSEEDAADRYGAVARTREAHQESAICPEYDIHSEPSSFKLSILMATYNEETTVTRAIEEVFKVSYPIEIELIVVDDGSTDQTEGLLEKLEDKRLIIHRHPVNRGKGAALRTGASLATGTHMLPFDADLEYTPDDIPRMLQPVLMGRCDVVYGARLFGYNTVYRSYWYAAGNKALTRLANILFNASVTDMHTCLKLIPFGIWRDLNLYENGFGLDTELTALLLRRGVRPFEVPVSYYGRSHAEGKKITWRDAFACMRILVRVRVRTRKRSEAKPSHWVAKFRTYDSSADESLIQQPLPRVLAAHAASADGPFDAADASSATPSTRPLVEQSRAEAT
jgi:dolichol-phosphate hexosyltransferase